MNVECVRFSSGPADTLGLLFVDERFECFVVEDPYQAKKVAGETRIPAGVYSLGLRTEGRLHEEYSKRFPGLHKGMIWIRDIPDFEFVYLHIGNTSRDSAGCPLLTNSIQQNRTGPGFGGHSTAAYLRVYPVILKGILEGDSTFSVWELDRGVR